MARNLRLTGVFLPSAADFTQRTADFGRPVRGGLGLGDYRATVELFVTIPRPHGVETRRLIRYPSPSGRPCTISCGPSFFSWKNDMLARMRDRRQVADHGRICALGFDLAVEPPQISCRENTEIEKGGLSCVSVSSHYWPGPGCLGLRLAETPCPSRRCWAPGPGRARRRCSMAASARARLWVRRAMSPIARPIRAVAADLKTSARQARTRNDFDRTTGAPCAGGLFDVAPAGAGTGRRDTACSRRS